VDRRYGKDIEDRDGVRRGEEERNVSIPIRVTAGSGNRRRWWSGDVHVVEASPDSL